MIGDSVFGLGTWDSGLSNVLYPRNPASLASEAGPQSPLLHHSATRTLARDLRVVSAGTPSSGHPDPSVRRMASHDHWFYSVSPREKEARKQEVGVARVVSI